MLQVGEGSRRIQSYRFSRTVPGMVSRNYQVDTVRRADWWGKGKGEKQRGDRCSEWEEAKGVNRADWWVQGKGERRSGDSCSRLKGSGGQTGGGNVKGERQMGSRTSSHALDRQKGSADF